jgi:RNase P protein component
MSSTEGWRLKENGTLCSRLRSEVKAIGLAEPRIHVANLFTNGAAFYLKKNERERIMVSKLDLAENAHLRDRLKRWIMVLVRTTSWT